MFIMFIWPMVVFRKYLRGKSLTFRFGFCVTVQIVIINALVITLGLLHILNPWIVRILFYGTFVYSIVCDIRIGEKQRKQLKRILTGTYGLKSFRVGIQTKIIDRAKEIKKNFLRMMRGHWWEYGLLSIILIYGAIYFSYGAFQDYSYGFGDMYPHNAWIYGLINGQIFSAGVYPEGMHCFLYSMHVLFDIRVYSCLLFTAGIHIIVFLLSAYVMLREVFGWKYSPMLALTLFLTMDLLCINEIYSMSRLQWTIPQEFGLYTQFLCAAFLLKYLRGKKQESKLERWKIFQKSYWNENLMVFMMALAASIVIHFYPTIMAFFLCVAFVPWRMVKVFTKGRFSALVFSVVFGLMIAVLPMAGALASGIPFQGSIGWAVNVINGVDSEQSGGSTTNTTTTTNPAVEVTPIPSTLEQAGNTVTQNTELATEVGSATNASKNEPVPTPEPVPQRSLVEKVTDILVKIKDTIVEKYKIVRSGSYVTLYRKERADVLLKFTALSAIVWLVLKVAWTIKKRVQWKKDIDSTCFDGYFGLTLASILFMMLYSASRLGLPSLIAGSRLCSVAQLLIMAVCVIPFDAIFTGLSYILKEGLMKVVAALSVLGIYVGTMLTGTFHGFLYYELTRYNAAVMSTYMITETLPQNSFTIVSTVDELYQVIQYGYHEEAVEFVNEAITDDYTIPTEYVFIFVEKHPLEYAQSHFFHGPKWLAWEKYADYYNSYVSQCPDITVSTISKDLATRPYTKLPVTSKMYSRLETRTLLESRLYAWCQDFDKLYPNELHTYYEDDDFVCYYFKQNPYSLFQLAIQSGG